MREQQRVALLCEPAFRIAGDADDAAAVVLHGEHRGLELHRLAGVGDGNDNVAFLQLAAGAVHRLRAVEEVGRCAGGREERGSVPRHMAGLSDAGHMDAVSRGAAFLNERDRVFVCLRRLLREKRAEFLFRGRGQMRERGFSFVFHLLFSSNCAKRS